MTVEDFVIDLFIRIYDAMKSVPKYTRAKLYPSELLALVYFMRSADVLCGSELLAPSSAWLDLPV